MGRSDRVATRRPILDLSQQQSRALAAAINAYNAANRYYDETFAEVGERVRISGQATKMDLSALFYWKRSPVARWSVRLLQMPDESVRSVTAAALAPGLGLADRLRHLTELPGFAIPAPVASALLSAWNPNEYPVMDLRAWTGLRRLGLETGGDEGDYVSYYQIVHTLMAIMADSGRRLGARDIDKGLYMLGTAS